MLQDTESLISVGDFIRWGASRFSEAGLFFGHGADNALDESLYLVAHALHLPANFPQQYFAARLTDSERAAVLELFMRRIEQRIPAAYLIGKAWFAGLEFQVNEQVLVPRSPFAELIEQHLQPWIDPEQVHTVLDLCTGSGCIGIAAAMHLPHTQVTLADISSEALDVARRNRADYGLEARVEIVQSDLFEALDDRRYDVILSNPPYVAQSEMDSLPDEYHKEPALGLAAGADGLDLARRILRDAAQRLEPTGVIIIEVGASAANLQRAFPDAPFLWLEFERGGEGVFLLSAEQLNEYSPIFQKEAEETP